MDDPRSELESMLSSSIDAELPFALERKKLNVQVPTGPMSGLYVRLLDPLAFVFPLHRVFDTFNHLTFGFPLLETFNNLTFALVEFGGALAR